jgi:hypothetical protein
MDPRRWDGVQAAFDEVVELEAAERASRLAAIGAADPELRGAVVCEPQPHCEGGCVEGRTVLIRRTCGSAKAWTPTSRTGSHTKSWCTQKLALTAATRADLASRGVTICVAREDDTPVARFPSFVCGVEGATHFQASEFGEAMVENV